MQNHDYFQKRSVLLKCDSSEANALIGKYLEPVCVSVRACLCMCVCVCVCVCVKKFLFFVFRFVRWRKDPEVTRLKLRA